MSGNCVKCFGPEHFKPYTEVKFDISTYMPTYICIEKFIHTLYTVQMASPTNAGYGSVCACDDKFLTCPL